MANSSHRREAGNPPYPITPTIPAPDTPEPFSELTASHDELRRNSWAEVKSPGKHIQRSTTPDSPISSTGSEWDSCDDAVPDEKIVSSISKLTLPSSLSINNADNPTHKLPRQLNGPTEDELENSNTVWEDVAQLNIHDNSAIAVAELPTQSSPTSSTGKTTAAFPNYIQASSNTQTYPNITQAGSPTNSQNPSSVGPSVPIPVSITGSNPWRRQSIETNNSLPEAINHIEASNNPWPAESSYKTASAEAPKNISPDLSPQNNIQNTPSTNPDILIENVDTPTSRPPLPQRPENSQPASSLSPQNPESSEAPPPLPPRTSESSLRAKAHEQKAEYYQVKRITWRDPNGQTRQSPILTQNANGPCPLLALVNAYILSTPTDRETPLTETLKLREHVSLGLLLDAVFEELTSGNRSEGAQALPDLSELYRFLVTLHSGMNVNPRFVTDVCSQDLIGTDGAGLADIHPAFRRDAKPGCFDETREMALYSTFNIPLIHGWVPAPDSATYDAFFRVAKTYEDTQNLLLKEEDLENKLRSAILTEEEQQLLLDITLIKEFLSTWRSQLSEYGLDIISRSMQPGQFAILFRNDHFSTLYKDIRSQCLFTLVTDAGYAGHESVIWESLVDVSGQANEFFSGDFTVVRDVPNTKKHVANERPIRSLLDDDDDYGQPATSSSHQAGGHASSSRISASSHDGFQTASAIADRAEQEDHDLALALQLQEEEEDRHRREEDSRRNERAEALSRTYLSQDSSQNIRPLVPPRRNGNHRNSSSVSSNNARNSNNNINRVSSRTGLRVSTAANPNARIGAGPAGAESGPPPAYAQAASERPYVPPAGHPASPEAPVQQGLGTNSFPSNHPSANANVNAIAGPGMTGQVQGQITSQVANQGQTQNQIPVSSNNVGANANASSRQRFSRVSPLIGQATSTIAGGIQRIQQQGHSQGQGYAQGQGHGQGAGQGQAQGQGLAATNTGAVGPDAEREKCIMM